MNIVNHTISLPSTMIIVTDIINQINIVQVLTIDIYSTILAKEKKTKTLESVF